MATANVTNKPVTFEIKNEGDFDILYAKLAMLTANLSIISGDGFDVFSRSNNEIQQHYIWGCASLADECRDIVNKNMEILTS